MAGPLPGEGNGGVVGWLVSAAPVSEAQIVALRRKRRLEPARIAAVLELNPATVRRVLIRAGIPRLSWLDRPTGEPVRRYERARPGELVVDVKKPR